LELVIIGLGAGGFADAFTARKFDKQCNITVIDPKSYDLLHACGLPYALEGRVAPEKLVQQLELNKMKINKIRALAKVIDIQGKIVKTDSGSELHYDKLILALGALPFLPSVPGIERAITLSSAENVAEIGKQIKANKSACVIGGGAIGLECAYALHKQGLACSIIEMESYLLPRSLDKDMAFLVEEYLHDLGIGIYLGEQVKEISNAKVIAENKALDADLVIAACGFIPNTVLAAQAGLLMEGKAIKVNKNMQTSHPDIYAIGDCALTYSTLTQKQIWAALSTTAYRQGLIAAAHALGNKATYAGTLSTFVSKVGEMEIAASGLSEMQAQRDNFKTVAARIRGQSIPEWMGKQEPLTLKLIVEKSSGRILGAQAVGRAGAIERINLFSCAMRAELKVQDLLDLELGYCPRLSDTYDLVNRVAEIALKKCSG
jgi:NADH oxidase (H2O2-forming)